MNEQPESTGPTTLAIDIGGTGLKASVLDAKGAMLGLTHRHSSGALQGPLDRSVEFSNLNRSGRPTPSSVWKGTTDRSGRLGPRRPGSLPVPAEAEPPRWSGRPLFLAPAAVVVLVAAAAGYDRVGPRAPAPGLRSRSVPGASRGG